LRSYPTGLFDDQLPAHQLRCQRQPGRVNKRSAKAVLVNSMPSASGCTEQAYRFGFLPCFTVPLTFL
jgi:hypothetical protein